MYVDNFARTMLGEDAGVSQIDSGNFGRVRRMISRTPGRATSFRSNSFEDQVARSMASMPGAQSAALANSGVKMRGMRNKHQSYKGLGFDYLMSGPKIYLHGDEQLGGWLTDLTKPVMSVARDVSSSALGVGRTVIKSAAPALVSAITGRPVSVGPNASDSSGQVQYVQAPKDNTMLYVGLGGAALLTVLIMTGRKK